MIVRISAASSARESEVDIVLRCGSEGAGLFWLGSELLMRGAGCYGHEGLRGWAVLLRPAYDAFRSRGGWRATLFGAMVSNPRM
jgi:hypothetical protein